MGTDRILTYAIVASVAAHLVVVSVVGGTSGCRFNTTPAPQTSGALRVELVRDPLEQPKPPSPRVAPAHPRPEAAAALHRAPEQPTVPATHPQARMSADARPRPWPSAPSSSLPAGDPGGGLNTGSASAQGDLPGSWTHGRTPVGWAPGSESGMGAGSGSGKGTGAPDPPARVDPGPGTRPAPNPTPPSRPAPPPAPRTVNVRVCSVSGMIPGKYCADTEIKSFVQGAEPSRTCAKCRAPEPAYTSTMADRQNPVLVRDSKVDAGILEEGLDVTVQVEYTVTAEGDVTGVKVIKSSGDRAVDRAVVNAASGLKYKPAVQNGVPRSVKMTRTYHIKT